MWERVAMFDGTEMEGNVEWSWKMKWKEIEDKMGEVRYGGKEMPDNDGR